MKDKKDWQIILLSACLFALCLAGCKTQAPIARTDTVTKTVIQELVKDTTIYLTDSAGFRALLECDSLGQVRVKQIQDYYAGQFIKPKVVIKDNYVTLDCKIDSAGVYVYWKERHESKEQTITTVNVVKENYVTGFQWAQIWAGRVFVLLLLLYVAYRVLKRYTAIPF
jgi:hypothetical protein